MNDLINDESESHRNSIPQSKPARSDPIDICTDCFFLLEQIRKKARQRHILPSNSFNRSSSRSTSNHNLSSSSSASSLAAILAQQQNSLMVKSTSIQSKSIQELTTNNDPLQTLTTIGATGGSQRVTLSRRNLFLKLQPAYDVKSANIKTG